jgi:hypothetical protein
MIPSDFPSLHCRRKLQHTRQSALLFLLLFSPRAVSYFSVAALLVPCEHPRFLAARIILHRHAVFSPIPSHLHHTARTHVTCPVPLTWLVSASPVLACTTRTDHTDTQTHGSFRSAAHVLLYDLCTLPLLPAETHLDHVNTEHRQHASTVIVGISCSFR